MKINWFSNAPFASTGYGNQTELFVKRIAGLGHQMSITAFFGLQGGPIFWNGIKVLPNHKHPYGQDVIVSHAMSEGAQVVISLIDAFVMQPSNFDRVPLKWIPWFPIDSEPIKPGDYATVSKAYKRIVFSKFAQKEMEKCGLDCYYVPHGVDTQLFRPVDMYEMRKGLKWPTDRFIVGMVAANKGYPPRKAFFEHLTAFAAFHKMYPDSLLYLHTDDGTRGGDNVDLPAYLSTLSLKYEYMHHQEIAPDTAVIFPDQYSNNVMGFPNGYMNAIYNAMDVHMLVSTGEGFGIPILEAQAAGCPVIVGDWTAMSELCFSGWKVAKKDADPVWTQFKTFQFRPHPGAIAEKLEAAYRMRGNNDYRKRARDGALAYDADKITEKYWKPVLEDIEASLSEETPVVAPTIGAAVGAVVEG